MFGEHSKLILIKFK